MCGCFCCPAFADAHGSADEEYGVACGEVPGFFAFVVVGGAHGYGSVFDFFDEFVSCGGESGFGVAVGGWFVSGECAEGSDAVDEAESGVGCGEGDHVFVHGGLAVGVVCAGCCGGEFCGFSGCGSG